MKTKNHDNLLTIDFEKMVDSYNREVEEQEVEQVVNGNGVVLAVGACFEDQLTRG